jgi:hypothetical protein
MPSTVRWACAMSGPPTSGSMMGGCGVRAASTS